MKSLNIVILFSALLTSCAPVYFPNQLQTPLLTDKNEFTISASAGISGVDAQVAYSPMKHFVLTGDASFNDTDDHEHLQFEAGAGGYTTINDLLQLEILGGGGAGYSTTTTNGTLGEHNEGMYSRHYIQPNVFLLSEYAEVGLATRLSFIHFRNYGTGVYTEPTLVARFGLEHVKFLVQGGLSLNINENSELDYNPFIFNIGLVYTFRK